MTSNVDTSLPPQPSGAAGQLASRHAREEPLKLYGGWFCPFVQRAWIVLVEKRIPHQYIEINPYRKDGDFLAMNPRGLVPTLAVPPSATGSTPRPLYESTVVCEYLDEEYADEDAHGPRLLAGSAYDRARARLWIDHVCTKIVPGFYKLLQHTPDKAYTLGQARGELQTSIRTLVAEMDHTGSGPWFLGERFGMVDVVLAPWAKRLWLIEHYKSGGVGIPRDREDGFDEIWARWGQWYDAVVERPSVRETWSDDERYVVAYKRYAEDTTNSLVGQATRSGQRLP
ncbi:hypothetical protein ACO1O0_004719 [Amphichorda felina]